MESPLDHSFTNYQVSIMQSCDQCSSYIWGMEKAYMCTCESRPNFFGFKCYRRNEALANETFLFFVHLLDCKMVCHKKCLSKITTDCSTFSAKKVGFSCLIGIIFKSDLST